MVVVNVDSYISIEDDYRNILHTLDQMAESNLFVRYEEGE